MSSIVVLLAIALAVVSVIRVLLLVRPPGNGKLPHPSKFGLPTGGLASAAAAHAALAGRSSRAWWKFW